MHKGTQEMARIICQLRAERMNDAGILTYVTSVMQMYGVGQLSEGDTRAKEGDARTD